MAIVYGSGTVIARMAHAHNRHGGPFEFCPRCGGIRWFPDRDAGIVVYDRGRLVEQSALAGRLLKP